MGRNTVSDQQKQACAFYGFPGSRNKPVGEIRYVVGWMADQMTRLDWDILIDGSDEWKVTLPATKDVEESTISTADNDNDVTLASEQLLALIDWDDDNVRGVTTNLFVAGQGDYAELDDGWQVVSVIDPDRKKRLDGVTSVPFLWPHPFDPSKPDAPLFAVLPLLEELDWLTRQGRTQSKQRVLTSGAWFISDGFQGPKGTDFWEQFNQSVSDRMEDTDDLSPIRFQGPHDLVKDGANWIKPDHDYDDVLDRRVVAAIQRLAYGLPVPPEILLGMQAQSRATAFQVEENAYRAHIEPPAKLVAQVAADALSLLLEDGLEVEVVPNPSSLLARRNSVQDVKDAYDRGLVTPTYVREVLGIPEDSAPENDGVAPATVAPAGSDPSNVAADEPVTAASSTPDLSTLLADIDRALTSELAGVTVMATDRARQRLGGVARSNQQIRSDPELKKLTSSQLAVKLGTDGLTAAGVDVGEQVAEPIDAACRWWVRRVGEVWNQMGTMIPGWAGQGAWVEESVSDLAEALTTHIVNTLTETDAPPLDAGSIRLVVNDAAGGSSGVR